MAIAVLHIALAAALPVWSHQIRREKEEELIFRGLQYAEAIRVFQVQFNRLPVRLEELIEVEPRCLRQLWLNPMSDDGSWGLLVGGLAPGGAQGRGPLGEPVANPAPGAPGASPATPGGAGAILRGGGREARSGKPQIGRPVATGPIQGVYSPEGGQAIKSFFGSNQISDWRFTPDLLRPQVPPPGSPATANGPLPVNAAFVGRPFPPGVTPPNQPPGQPAPTGSPGGAPGGAPAPPAPEGESKG